MLIDQIATPLIWTPEQEDPAVRDAEIEKMFVRSQATADMLAGIISFEDFCDVLNDQYIDVDACLNDWEAGLTYL